MIEIIVLSVWFGGAIILFLVAGMYHSQTEKNVIYHVAPFIFIWPFMVCILIIYAPFWWAFRLGQNIGDLFWRKM